MNPRKEFVKAIMSVLRLEQNIYTVASIEEIIDRIDQDDYTIFIAYLGERNSDFERPIQTIAKATDDFYEKKMLPLLEGTKSKLEESRDYISKLIGFLQYKEVGMNYASLCNEYDNRTLPFVENNEKRPIETWREAEDKARQDVEHMSNEEINEVSFKIVGMDDITRVNIDFDLMDEYGLTIENIQSADIPNIVREKIMKLSIIGKIEEKAENVACKELSIQSNKISTLMKKALHTNTVTW